MIPQFKASQIIFQSLSRWYLITLRETGLYKPAYLGDAFDFLPQWYFKIFLCNDGKYQVAQ